MGILNSPQVRELQRTNFDKQEISLVSESPLDEEMILRPEVRIHIRHRDGVKKILAVPDKGSEVNAMSLAFAQSMGYSIDRKAISQYTLRLASGLMIRSVGTVCASFEIDMKSARLDLLQKTFAVIVNFPLNIAFGNAFIRELKIFEANLSCLEWVHVREDLPLLCPLIGKQHGIFCTIKCAIKREKYGISLWTVYELETNPLNEQLGESLRQIPPGKHR